MLNQLFAYVSNSQNWSSLIFIYLEQEPFIKLMGQPLSHNNSQCSLPKLLGYLYGANAVIKDLIDDIDIKHNQLMTPINLQKLYKSFKKKYVTYLQRLPIKNLEDQTQLINNDDDKSNHIQICKNCFDCFKKHQSGLTQKLHELLNTVFVNQCFFGGRLPSEFILASIKNEMQNKLFHFVDKIQEQRKSCQRVNKQQGKSLQHLASISGVKTFDNQYKILQTIFKEMKEKNEFKLWIQIFQNLLIKNVVIYKTLWNKEGSTIQYKIRNQKIIKSKVKNYGTLLKQDGSQVLIFKATFQNMQNVKKKLYLTQKKQKDIFKAKPNQINNGREYLFQLIQYHVKQEIFALNFNSEGDYQKYDNLIMKNGKTTYLKFRQNNQGSSRISIEQKISSNSLKFASQKQIKSGSLLNIPNNISFYIPNNVSSNTLKSIPSKNSINDSDKFAHVKPKVNFQYNKQ